MKTELMVEMYAIAAGVEGDRGVGTISHDLQVTTETDNLRIPVTANILLVGCCFTSGPASTRMGDCLWPIKMCQCIM